MISIVSFDPWSSHFSQSFAAVYGAELFFSLNNYCRFNSELANAVACVVLLTKVDDQQQIYLCLYLFPALCFLYFLSIASCAQTSESTWSNLSFQYSSNSSFGYQVSKMVVFSSSNLSKLFGISLVFLSKSPFKLNIEI